LSCFLLIFMQPNVLMCANLSKPCTLPAKHMGNGQPKPVGGSARKGKGRRSVPLGGQLERSAMRAMYDDSKQRRCPPAAPRSTFADADPGNPLLSRFWNAHTRTMRWATTDVPRRRWRSRSKGASACFFTACMRAHQVCGEDTREQVRLLVCGGAHAQKLGSRSTTPRAEVGTGCRRREAAHLQSLWRCNRQCSLCARASARTPLTRPAVCQGEYERAFEPTATLAPVRSARVRSTHLHAGLTGLRLEKFVDAGNLSVEQIEKLLLGVHERHHVAARACLGSAQQREGEALLSP
jgi:hypothetical protein